MTHIQVTHYAEVWQGSGKSLLAIDPGVFPYLFIKDMFGEAFIRDGLADGTLVPVAGDGIDTALAMVFGAPSAPIQNQTTGAYTHTLKINAEEMR